MQFRKLTAVAGSALIGALSIAAPVLASTVSQVGQINSLVSVDQTTQAVSFPWFVVGASAQTADVAGAVDVAVRLAAQAKTTVSVSGTGAAVNGISRNGIRIGGSNVNAAGNLANATTGGSAFPSGTLRAIHYPNLFDGTLTYQGSSYNVRDDVDVSGVFVRNGLSVEKVNGTLTLDIGDNDLIYDYIFGTTIVGIGGISNPNYTYPVVVKLMGKPFTIVGSDATTIKALVGATGTSDATTGVTYGTYTAYATEGATDSWAKVVIKDATGNTVDSLIISNTQSKDSSATGLTIKVTSVKARQDNTIVGADLVVGPTGSVEHTYDSSADVTSTGTTSDRFPGETQWAIDFQAASGTAQGAGNLATNSKIRVVYLPNTASGNNVFLRAGQSISLPGNFANLGLLGFNTNTFATVTLKPVGPISGYFQNGTLMYTNLYGLQISSDTPGSIWSLQNSATLGKNNPYAKAYVLFNSSNGANGGVVAVGYPDPTGKILLNDTIKPSPTANSTFGRQEYAWANLWTGTAPIPTGNFVDFPFIINQGETDFVLNVTVSVGLASTTVTASTNIRAWAGAGSSIAAAAADQTGVVMDWRNTTTWGSDFSSTPMKIQLGTTLNSRDAREVNISTEGFAVTNSQSGQDGSSAQQNVVTDSGIQLINQYDNGPSEKVVIQFPSKTLAANIYFGQLTGGATGAGTADKIIPITTDVVKLDSEVTAADQSAADLVLVGGPCVNTLVAALNTAGKFAYSCSSWPGSNFGWIGLINDAFATGKTVLIIAGTRAADTDLAARVVQDGTKLAGSIKSSVQVTGTTISDVVVT